jgi:hypothetical protein
MGDVMQQDIATVIQSWIANSTTQTSDLQRNREDATKFYLGLPIGGERAGRSNVVMTDVQDVVDWMTPSLIKIFCGERAAVSFLPVSKEDVDQAKIETEYCNWVLQTKNQGFEIINNWVQDGLVYRNGYIKVSYENKKDQRVEEYKAVDPQQMMMLQSDNTYELTEIQPYIDQQAGVELYNVKGKRLITQSGIVVRNVPPENIHVARDYRRVNLDECPFIGHYEEKTVGDMIAEGYDRDLIESLPSSYNNSEPNTVDDIRNTGVQSSSQYLGRSINDESTRMLRVWECHVRYDADNDGIPELHRVCYEETSKTVIHDEVVDFVNICAWSPYMVAHRHIGLSVYDKLRELAKIKTTLTRQMLDNLYLANNPRPIVDDSMVNMGDLLSPRIGAPIRVKSGRMEAVRFDAVPFVAANTYPFLEYMDKVREERSGVSRQTQGLDPASLKDQSIYGMSSIMSAATQKIEYVARAFGECGIKDLMRKIRALSAKYADKQEIFQVAGNRFSTTDPRAWTKMRDMRVLVGVGNTGMDQRSMALQLIQTLQEKIIEAQGGAVAGMGAPMVDAMNVYNSITDTLENFGVYEEDRYFKRPNMEVMAQMADMPPPPNPMVEVAVKELQQKEQSKLVDSQIAMAQHQDNLDIKREDNRIQQERLAIERARVENEFKIKDRQIVADLTNQIIASGSKNDGSSVEELAASVARALDESSESLRRVVEEQAKQSNIIASSLNAEKELVLDKNGNPIGSRNKSIAAS